jgi:ADP-ribose pyrophosphatase YjhB (NUDIX family)
MTQNGMVECLTMYGKTKLVPQDALQFRPSVYGVILHEGKILLLKAKATGKWLVPGGGLDKGELLADGLRREVREETGIAVEIERFAMLSERFFYYDPLEVAHHVHAFFYICRPRTFELAADDEIDDEEAEKPQWVDYASLTADSIQSYADELGAIREMVLI